MFNVFINQLTVRQGADYDVLSGDAWAVLVVGHHPETVFSVLLQPSHGVGLTVYVDVLKDSEGGRGTFTRHLFDQKTDCKPPLQLRFQCHSIMFLFFFSLLSGILLCGDNGTNYTELVCIM